MGACLTPRSTQTIYSLNHVPQPIDNILDEEKYSNLQKAINSRQFYHYSFVQLREQVYVHNDEGMSIGNKDQLVTGKEQYRQYLKVLNNSQINNSKEVKATLEKLYRNYKLKEIKEKNKNKLTQKELSYLDDMNIDQKIIKLFLFFFTADQIFPKYLKNTLRHSQYNQICGIVNLLKDHIAKKNDQEEKDDILKRHEYILYRGFGGINNPIALQINRIGVKGHKFFGSFYMLELQKKKVQSSNCYIKIKLDQNHPHDSMLIKPPLCKTGQKLIIMFPFFYFEVEKCLIATSKNLIQIKQVYPIEDQEV